MALLVHLSTDYIFDGKEGPYPEDYKPKPLGYYGKSKLASENAVRIAGIPYAIVRYGFNLLQFYVSYYFSVNKVKTTGILNNIN